MPNGRPCFLKISLIPRNDIFRLIKILTFSVAVALWATRSPQANGYIATVFLILHSSIPRNGVFWIIIYSQLLCHRFLLSCFL